MSRISKGGSKDKMSWGQPIFYFAGVIGLAIVYMVIRANYSMKAKIMDKASLEISPPPSPVTPAASRTLAPLQGGGPP